MHCEPGFGAFSAIDKDGTVGHYGCVQVAVDSGCWQSILAVYYGVEGRMSEFIRRIWSEEAGQDIAEYAVMLAVILVLVVGTIRLIGSNANNAFSNVASSMQ
jgi:Flp pilus assembly pilin Flp